MNRIFPSSLRARPAARATAAVVTTDGSVPILTDRTFKYETSSGELAGSAILGSLDAEGSAKGMLRVQQAPFDYDGVRYTCGVTTTEWTAKIQR